MVFLHKRIAIIGFILGLLLPLSVFAQDGPEDQGRRRFLRGFAAALAVSQMPGSLPVGDGQLGLPDKAMTKEVIAEIKRRYLTPENFQLENLIDYVREMRGLAAAAPPSMKASILTEVSRVEKVLSEAVKYNPSQTISPNSKKIDGEVRPEIKSKEGREVLNQVDWTRPDYSLFVVRSMLAPEILMRAQWALHFQVDARQTLSFSELQLLLDYLKITEALYDLLEKDPLMRRQAGRFIFEVESVLGLDGKDQSLYLKKIKSYRTVFCRHAFGV